MSKGSVCINCKRYTKDGHYVAPSMGEEGFFICEYQAVAPSPKTKFIEVMKGVTREVPNDDA